MSDLEMVQQQFSPEEQAPFDKLSSVQSIGNVSIGNGLLELELDRPYTRPSGATITRRSVPDAVIAETLVSYTPVQD